MAIGGSRATILARLDRLRPGSANGVYGTEEPASIGNFRSKHRDTHKHTITHPSTFSNNTLAYKFEITLMVLLMSRLSLTREVSQVPRILLGHSGQVGDLCRGCVCAKLADRTADELHVI